MILRKLIPTIKPNNVCVSLLILNGMLKKEKNEQIFIFYLQIHLFFLFDIGSLSP